MSKERTLHVHHRFYEKNKNPWEYDNSALITLCDSCHKIEEYVIKGVRGYVKHLEREDFLLYGCCPICDNKDINNFRELDYYCTICYFQEIYKHKN